MQITLNASRRGDALAKLKKNVIYSALPEKVDKT